MENHFALKCSPSVKNSSLGKIELNLWISTSAMEVPPMSHRVYKLPHSFIQPVQEVEVRKDARQDLCPKPFSAAINAGPNLGRGLLVK